MRVLITGSTGNVGKELVPFLIMSGHVVIEVSRNLEKSKNLFKDTTVKIDLNSDNFKELVELSRPDVVIHLAAYLTASDELNEIEALIQSNILLTSRLLNALSHTKIKAFINTGSFAEYNSGGQNFDPAYFYAATKIATRYIVDYFSKSFYFKQITIVPYTIYGGIDSKKKLIDYLIASINTQKPLDLSPGNQVLDFIHIDDVCKFYEKVLNKIDDLPDKIEFRLGSGVGKTPREAVKEIEEITGQSANINWGGVSYRKTDTMYSVADLYYSKVFLDWKPEVSFKEGVKNYIYKCNK